MHRLSDKRSLSEHHTDLLSCVIMCHFVTLHYLLTVTFLIVLTLNVPKTDSDQKLFHNDIYYDCDVTCLTGMVCKAMETCFKLQLLPNNFENR